MVPSETPEPGPAVSSLPGKERGSGILWDPLWLRGAAEAV